MTSGAKMMMILLNNDENDKTRGIKRNVRSAAFARGVGNVIMAAAGVASRK